MLTLTKPISRNKHILHAKREKYTIDLVLCWIFVNFASKICRMCLDGNIVPHGI